MSEKEIRQISIRLPANVYVKAQEIAKRKGMSFNSLISQIVSEYFEETEDTVLQEIIRRIDRLENEVFKK